MTSDQELHGAGHATLMAVAYSLTGDEQMALLHDVGNRWPHLHGATVADVLDYTTDYDQFLDKTEPFLTRFAGQIPAYEGDYAALYAMHVILLLGLELTPARLAYFLQRAGVCEAPRYPDVVAGILMEGSYRDGAPCVNHLTILARAEQALRAHGVDEYEITQFRAAVRVTPLPGYSRNVADIAAWVTLADRYVPLAGVRYDPAHDLAVVLLASAEATYRARTSPELHQALVNLQAHVGTSSVEEAEAHIRDFFKRGPRSA